MRATDAVGISSGFARMAQRRRLASPRHAGKKFPEAAVPPTKALSPAFAGSEIVWDDPDGEARLWAYHNTGMLWCQYPSPHCIRVPAAAEAQAHTIVRA